MSRPHGGPGGRGLQRRKTLNLPLEISSVNLDRIVYNYSLFLYC